SRVFEHDGLAKRCFHVFGNRAAHRISSYTRRESHDHSHRPRRIGLRESDARRDRQRGGARGQMQELAAGKVHFLTSHHSITPSTRGGSVGGTSRPSALAGLEVITRPKLVRCCTRRTPAL